MDMPSFPCQHCRATYPCNGAPPLMVGTRIYVSYGMVQRACCHRVVAKCSNQLKSVSADSADDKGYDIML